MQTVTIGGVKFRLPFLDDERRLTAAEWEDLLASVGKHGVIEPVTCRQEERKPRVEETVIVGAHRTLVVAELGLDKIPIKLRSFKTMEDAREFNRQTSIRRHYTAEEQHDRRVARMQRVAAARQEGQSIRMIAETENVSTATVQKDLETVSTVNGVTVEPANGVVTGQDGRTRTASTRKICEGCQRKGVRPDCDACKELNRKGKKKPEPESNGTAEEEHGDAWEPPQPTDKFGREVPAVAMEAFQSIERFEQIDSLLRKVQSEIDALSKQPGGEQLRRLVQPTGSEEKRINKSEHLNALKRDLRFSRMHAVCPYCHPKPVKSCKGCNGLGWVTETTYKDAPEELKVVTV